MRRLALTVVALACAFPAAATAATPMDARAFVDTQGVNVHLSYDNTRYWDYPVVKAKLQELGVRHVRDECHGDTWSRDTTNARYLDLASVGITLDYIAGRPPVRAGSMLDQCMYNAKNRIRSAVESLEGPNEWDNVGRSNWAAELREYAYWLRQIQSGTSLGDPIDVPVLAPALVHPASHGTLGDLTPHVDRGNTHSYPGNQAPQFANFGRTLSRALTDASINAPGKPVIASESGYHNALSHTGGHKPVSERASGIYLPRLYFEYARAGVERTFLYELLDLSADDKKTNEQAHFGLFRHDWSYKPAATAIKNMNAWLDGPSGPRTPLDYSMTNTADPDGSGTKGEVRHQLMQKADGSYWLAVWQNSSVWNNHTGGDIQNSSVKARVNLPRTMKVECFRPATGGTCGSLAGSSGFGMNVTDDVMLLKLTG